MMMGQLSRLPQSTILWGHDILQEAITHLDQYGIAHPITLTAEALEGLNQLRVRPYVKKSVGTVTDLPAHVPDSHVRMALETCKRTGAKSIIALGGGSVLDAAKAVSYL